MAKIKGYVSTRMVGSKVKFEFEIEDEDIAEMDDYEIEALALEAMFDHIEWNYEVVK